MSKPFTVIKSKDNGLTTSPCQLSSRQILVQWVDYQYEERGNKGWNLLMYS